MYGAEDTLDGQRTWILVDDMEAVGQLSTEQKGTPGYLVYIGHEILVSYIGIITSHETRILTIN